VPRRWSRWSSRPPAMARGSVSRTGASRTRRQPASTSSARLRFSRHLDEHCAEGVSAPKRAETPLSGDRRSHRGTTGRGPLRPGGRCRAPKRTRSSFSVSRFSPPSGRTGRTCPACRGRARKMLFCSVRLRAGNEGEHRAQDCDPIPFGERRVDHVERVTRSSMAGFLEQQPAYP